MNMYQYKIQEQRYTLVCQVSNNALLQLRPQSTNVFDLFTLTIDI